MTEHVEKFPHLLVCFVENSGRFWCGSSHPGLLVLERLHESYARQIDDEREHPPRAQASRDTPAMPGAIPVPARPTGGKGREVAQPNSQWRLSPPVERDLSTAQFAES